MRCDCVHTATPVAALRTLYILVLHDIFGVIVCVRAESGYWSLSVGWYIPQDLFAADILLSVCKSGHFPRRQRGICRGYIVLV